MISIKVPPRIRLFLAMVFVLTLLSTSFVANPVTINAAVPEYQFIPSHRPNLASDVVVWTITDPNNKTIPSTMLGDWSKYLLIVLPDVPMKGGISAKYIKYKGVYVIGGEFDKEGSINYTSEANKLLPGGHAMQIGFAAGATIRPFVFVSNIDFDLGTNTSGLPYKSYWGDFLQTGTNSTNKAEWADIYMQKNKIRRGHYFWTAAENQSFDPHSDVFQAACGGWRRLYAANMDYTWYGQGFFMVPSDISGMTDAPPDGRVILKDIVARPMGPSTDVYKGLGYVNYLVHFNQYHSNLDPNIGDYYSVFLNNFNFLKQHADSNQTYPPSYFSVKSATKNVDYTLRNVSFQYVQHPNHAFPYFDGVGASSSNWAYTHYEDSWEGLPSVVFEGDIGRSKRITTAGDLVNLFAPIQTTNIIADRDSFVYDGATTTNYGTNTALVVKDTNTAGANRHSYIGCNLSGFSGKIASAKLRFYAKNTARDNGSVPINIYRTSDSWTETGINWSNAPAAPSNISLGTVNITGPINTFAWYEVDVTAYIQSEYIGDKYVSFLLKNDSKVGDYLELLSEETSYDPQLVINYYQ